MINAHQKFTAEAREAACTWATKDNSGWTFKSYMLAAAIAFGVAVGTGAIQKAEGAPTEEVHIQLN